MGLSPLTLIIFGIALTVPDDTLYDLKGVYGREEIVSSV
jgi:hypothetical protein